MLLNLSKKITEFPLLKAIEENFEFTNFAVGVGAGVVSNVASKMGYPSGGFIVASAGGALTENTASAQINYAAGAAAGWAGVNYAGPVLKSALGVGLLTVKIGTGVGALLAVAGGLDYLFNEGNYTTAAGDYAKNIYSNVTTNVCEDDFMKENIPFCAGETNNPAEGTEL